MKKYVLGLFGVMLACGGLPGSARADGNVKINPVDGAEMVWVPAGPFTMGSTDADDQAQPNEKPAHTVYLDGYWIYKNEVTVGQYKKFCAATKHKMQPTGDADDHPMMMSVGWNDAQAYCAWAGVKLPTEAQWEKAARGTDGRIYPWGNEWDERGVKANTRAYQESNHVFGTTPVGSFPEGASPYGCLDMAGNVWEWCQDRYQVDYYKSSPASNPTGPDSGDRHVLRGGSFGDKSLYVRCAYRNDYKTVLDFGALFGFRCALPGQ